MNSVVTNSWDRIEIQTIGLAKALREGQYGEGMLSSIGCKPAS
jgi:hypothetical protein